MVRAIRQLMLGQGRSSAHGGSSYVSRPLSADVILYAGHGVSLSGRGTLHHLGDEAAAAEATSHRAEAVLCKRPSPIGDAGALPALDAAVDTTHRSDEPASERASDRASESPRTISRIARNRTTTVGLGFPLGRNPASSFSRPQPGPPSWPCSGDILDLSAASCALRAQPRFQASETCRRLPWPSQPSDGRGRRLAGLFRPVH